MTPALAAALDRQERVEISLGALADLLAPEENLQVDQRDSLSILFNLLLDELKTASATVRELSFEQ